MYRPAATALTILAVFALAACSPPADPEPDPEPAASSDDGGSGAEVPCIVGTWQLDVGDYAAQSEAFVLGLGLPITGFAMSGAGTIEFTADGLVATAVDLTTTGTIVAGDVSVPLNTRSVYTGSGDWSDPGDGETVDLQNWATVPDADVPIDPEAPDLPAIDYTDIPSVVVSCTASTLTLQGPDAPLSASWTR